MSALITRQNTSSGPKLPHLGQGKRATTILADQGDYVHVITDVPYATRSQHKPALYYKGGRPMHRTSLVIPTQRDTDYTTTNYCHASRRDLPSPKRRHPTMSQHTSQIKFGMEENNQWLTKYTWDYPGRDPAPPAVLHYPEQVNKVNMNEGTSMKQSLHSTDRQGAGTTFTQYNRVHNKLGAALGHGVSREYPVREQYDPLTGVCTGAAWSADNKRVSGNRVLYNGHRRQVTGAFTLG